MNRCGGALIDKQWVLSTALLLDGQMGKYVDACAPGQTATKFTYPHYIEFHLNLSMKLTPF